MSKAKTHPATQAVTKDHSLNDKLSSDLRLLKAGKLSPDEILRASLALKRFIRNHRRQTHQKICRLLGLGKRRFYRFLAISGWSKKVRSLITDQGLCLSQTALFRMADRKWLDARQMFNFMNKLILYLTHRKRRQLKRVKSTDRVGRFLQSPLKKEFKYLLMDKIDGKTFTVNSGGREKLLPYMGPDGRYCQVGRYLTQE